VAISGTTALVGAPGWYSMDGAQPWPYAEGVAFFYSYQDLEVGTDSPGWQWVETAEIGDPASTAYDHFGNVGGALRRMHPPVWSASPA